MTMTKTLTLMALLLGSATANAGQAMSQPGFGTDTVFSGDPVADFTSPPVMGGRIVDVRGRDVVLTPGRGRLATPIVAVGGVPEPASWMLMVAGFGLVGAVARRRTAGVVAA